MNKDENSFLSKDAITEIVHDYYTAKPYPFALLLDGEWGCGKTYYVKNELIPSLEKKSINVVYITLYGIPTIKELVTGIYLSVAESRIFKGKGSIGKKAKPIVNLIGNAILDKLSVADTLENSLNSILAEFVGVEKVMFIFDDLERCAIPVNEIMGAINNLVEQNEINTLIIANESEIAKKEEYSRIKEKLIGKTIVFKPNLSDTLSLIFDQLGEQVCLKSIYSQCEERIIRMLTKNEHNNFRTVQFAFDFFRKIASIDIDYKTSELRQKILSDLLLAIVTASVQHKQGISAPYWDKGERYGYKTENEKSDPLFSYRFVHEYVYYSILDKANVAKDIKKYHDELVGLINQQNDPLVKLEQYWEKDDCEIEESLMELCRNLESGNYLPSSFAFIISLLYLLRSLGFQIDIEGLFDTFVQQAQNSDIDDHAYISRMNDDNPLFNDYLEYMRRLREKTNQSARVDYAQVLTSIMNGATWGYDLYVFFSSNRLDLHKQKKFLGFIDVDFLIQRIHSASAKNLSDFRRCIATVYTSDQVCSEFVEDICILKSVYSSLKEVKFDSKIIEYNRTLFLANLEDILSKCKNAVS